MTQQPIINAIPDGLTAIQAAAAYYKRYNIQPGFEQDVAHYLAYGMMISRPDIFAMVKVVDLGGSACPQADASGPANALGTRRSTKAWFLQLAVGPLDRLAAVLPFYLPRICFCRRNDGRLRVYPMDRFLKRIELQTKRGE